MAVGDGMINRTPRIKLTTRDQSLRQSQNVPGDGQVVEMWKNREAVLKKPLGSIILYYFGFRGDLARTRKWDWTPAISVDWSSYKWGELINPDTIPVMNVDQPPSIEFINWKWWVESEVWEESFHQTLAQY